ncbi:MerR family transcriptional regulator [Embleya scabrispora]|uniref:MerR family transcriptional regulator n=1 Tax=Embleya scabrispora TaxID=159449 RepID=A0A1T3P6S5_9ACTN|nr:MerR family transcriptional regulator [Embleya scabrispora]OPC84702.1 MerR family transcriptional regulator [Embleya scabrispora]
MRIGDAAAAAGATPRALRFYEQRGLLAPPARSASGQRVYGPDDVARVRTIRELLALGLTVEDIRGFASRLDLLTELTEDSELRCSATAMASDGLDESSAAARTSVGSPASAAVVRRLGVLDAEIDRLTRLRDRLARAAAGQNPSAR